MSLTDRQLIALKPKAKPYRIFDGGGLHIYLSSAGGKLWRMTYRFNGVTRLLSFGAYPAVTLKMARDCRDETKSLIARGIDPSDHKKWRKNWPRPLPKTRSRRLRGNGTLNFQKHGMKNTAKTYWRAWKRTFSPLLGECRSVP